mgnify:CR=1 FL=1
MTEQVYLAIRHLVDVVAKEANEQCVSFKVFASYRELSISYDVRTPEGHSGIGMKNLKGEWIK